MTEQQRRGRIRRWLRFRRTVPALIVAAVLATLAVAMGPSAGATIQPVDTASGFPIGQVFHIRNDLAKKCLNIRTQDNHTVQLYSCGSLREEYWEVSSSYGSSSYVKIFSVKFPDYCLTAGGITLQSPVVIEPCNTPGATKPGQYWHHTFSTVTQYSHVLDDWTPASYANALDARTQTIHSNAPIVQMYTVQTAGGAPQQLWNAY